MSTTEIPRNEWAAFCQQFGRDHAGQAVNVETSCWETCSIYQMARRLPLSSIIFTPSDGQSGVTFSIVVGDKPQDHVVHKITRPSRVSLQTTGKGDPETLRIESEDGIVTVVTFGPPDSAARPDA